MPPSSPEAPPLLTTLLSCPAGMRTVILMTSRVENSESTDTYNVLSACMHGRHNGNVSYALVVLPTGHPAVAALGLQSTYGPRVKSLQIGVS